MELQHYILRLMYSQYKREHKKYYFYVIHEVGLIGSIKVILGCKHVMIRGIHKRKMAIVNLTHLFIPGHVHKKVFAICHHKNTNTFRRVKISTCLCQVHSALLQFCQLIIQRSARQYPINLFFDEDCCRHLKPPYFQQRKLDTDRRMAKRFHQDITQQGEKKDKGLCKYTCHMGWRRITWREMVEKNMEDRYVAYRLFNNPLPINFMKN